ncbi:MAG TPA: methylmalonyl-CoA carboxyltransferase, partial [Tessaracoccus flavescens]|nr:methylmalonyl-CoA carboxyltransferase [Tessaracoccus flavescens]
TGEDISAEELGGAWVHAGTSGVAQVIADDEQHALNLTKSLLSYLPQNHTEDPPLLEPYDPADRMDEALQSIIPADDALPYDMRDVLDSIFDHDSVFELHKEWAGNALVGFARLDGMSVGFVANQPLVLSGCLDINASDKIARHVTLCDQFNIPLFTFVDCPGYLPGVEQEYKGVIRHGAKMIYAYCQATVPKVSIVTRKAMGGSYVAMSSKQMNNDVAFAWPSAQIAVMGAEGAARLLNRRAIAEADDPAAEEARFIAEYKERFYNPYQAADVGQIDEVIEPRETRPRLIRSLEVLRTKVTETIPKKHGLFPV